MECCLAAPPGSLGTCVRDLAHVQGHLGFPQGNLVLHLKSWESLYFFLGQTYETTLLRRLSLGTNVMVSNRHLSFWWAENHLCVCCFLSPHSCPDSRGPTPGTALYLTTVGPRCAPHTVFDLVL